MSVTVVKDNGVTVVTLATDEKSMSPPLCQILKTLCYSPICCSVHKGLMKTSVTAALGTIQIMAGLFNIALGPGRTYVHPRDVTGPSDAYWLGAVFIAAGIMTLLAGGFPSLFMVVFAVVVNIVSLISAFAGAFLYARNMAAATTSTICDGYRNNDPSFVSSCRYVAFGFQGLLSIIDLTMIVLAVLQVCVCISFVVLAIKALVKRKKKEGGKDVKDQQSQLKEVLLTSPGA
ncbi:uncharacterized protein LOC125892746 isoform X1 [Epinephelus fuscoguttatus]|uniref:uncharacterized protein LOC125892746 isoform X1 n=1 Tax=Epinephelus fuscoguttatus TaxID=293821 RepID=UPI0020D17CD5|nr:uncharacterized protein LOC125892746 isoform X1 [Epinephelus fuscoguttatus]